MTKKSIIEDALDSVGSKFDRERFAEEFAKVRAEDLRRRRCLALEPGRAGVTHVSHERAKQFPHLFAQDGPVRSSVAVRNRASGAATYIGPFGLWLFARDTAKFFGVRFRKSDGIVSSLVG